MTTLPSPRFAHHAHKLCWASQPEEFVRHANAMLTHAQTLRLLDAGEESMPRQVPVRASVLKRLCIDVRSGRLLHLEGVETQLRREMLPRLRKAYERCAKNPAYLYNFERLVMLADHYEVSPGEDGDVLILTRLRPLSPEELLNPNPNWLKPREADEQYDDEDDEAAEMETYGTNFSRT